MLFTSFGFILFLAILFPLYYLVPKRFQWMLLLAALTCAMAAWIVLTCFVTQQYTSSTTFSVTTRTSNLYYTNITAAADVAASYSQLLQSRVLRQTMEQNLGMPLNGTVSAQQLGETNLIRVTVTADTPRQALVLLQAVSDNYGSLSAHVSSSAVLTQLNAPSLSVSAARSYNVPRTCLIAAAAGAALTAATQNVEECLRSETARLMFANSEFLVLLNQAATDRAELAKLLNISENQMGYVTNAEAGHGLLRVGGAIVPFANEFPRTGALYQLWNTTPTDK